MNSMENKVIGTLSSIEEVFSGFNVDTIKTDGMSIRIGNKLLKFDVISDDVLSIEDELRLEFGEKINNKLKFIRKHVEKKINEMSDFVSNIRGEYENKRKELEVRLTETSLMPNINLNDAEKGISVVKGSSEDSLVWLVQGIYKPEFIDNVPIKKLYTKKLITLVTFMVETKGDKVIRVTTRKPIGLNYFEHYHQSKPDCWGDWKHNTTWKTAQDIINISKEAEAVLVNINSNSIAIRNPRSFPRLDTLKKNLIFDTPVSKTEQKFTNDLKRAGVTSDISDTWDTYTTS